MKRAQQPSLFGSDHGRRRVLPRAAALSGALGALRGFCGVGEVSGEGVREEWGAGVALYRQGRGEGGGGSQPVKETGGSGGR
jgi:hypothetical protein